MGFFNNFGRTCKQYAPEIMIGTGTVSLLLGTFFAVKNMPKAAEVVKKYKKEREVLTENYNILIESGAVERGEYSKKKYDSELIGSYVKEGLEIAKVEAPAIACSTLGVGLNTAGIIMEIGAKKALVQGIAAATTTATAAVAELNELKKSITNVEEVTVTDDDGNEKKVRKITIEEKAGEKDPDGFVGTPFTGAWTMKIGPGHPIYETAGGDVNMMLPALWVIRSTLNDCLKRNGTVDLDQALHELYFNRKEYNVTTARAFGWTYKTDKDGNYIGEDSNCGVIDFGIGDEEHPEIIIEQDENGNDCVILDFNCDAKPLGNAWEDCKK